MGVGARKWLSITADIVAFELDNWETGELLSDVAHRWVRRNPIAARAAIISAGALITAHLAKILDPQYDVLSKSCWLWGRVPGAWDSRAWSHPLTRTVREWWPRDKLATLAHPPLRSLS